MSLGYYAVHIGILQVGIIILGAIFIYAYVSPFDQIYTNCRIYIAFNHNIIHRYHITYHDIFYLYPICPYNWYMSTYAYVSPFLHISLYLPILIAFVRILTILAIVYRILCRIAYIGISRSRKLQRNHAIVANIVGTHILQRCEILAYL
jgi:hypothetical protein